MVGAGQAGPQLSITDPSVCRSYIVGTCPSDLFTNTRGDIGACPKKHSEALKAEYDAADEAQKRRWGFEFEYLRDLQHQIEDCNRKINSAQMRLEKTPDEIARSNALLKQIADLSKTINTSILEIQVMSESGLVNQAYAEFFKLRQAKHTKEERERELKELSDTSGPSGHQKLQVCDVCGAYLSRLDNDRRLADHFYGKMHLGFSQMRKTYEKLQKELKGRQPPPRQEEPSERGEPGGYGERGPGYGRGGYRGAGGGYGRRGGYGGGRGGFGRW